MMADTEPPPYKLLMEVERGRSLQSGTPGNPQKHI